MLPALVIELLIAIDWQRWFALWLGHGLLTYAVAQAWEKFKDAPWRIAVQAGLIPVTVGLIAASAYLLARAADHNIAAYAITAATAGISYFTRINPLWAMAAAAAAGFLGLV